MNPLCAAPVYYVFGFWNNYGDTRPFVTKDGKPYIEEYDNLSDALKKINSEIPLNVNIIWSVCQSKPVIM